MNRPENALEQRPNQAAWISLAPDGTLAWGGAWTLAHLAELENQISSLPKTFTGGVTCEAGAIESLDTGGAWLLQRTLNHFESGGCPVSLNGLSADFSMLMQTVARSWSLSESPQAMAPTGWLERIGRFAWSYADHCH